MMETDVLTNRCVMDEATLRRTYARINRRTLLLFYGGSGLMLAASLTLILLGGLSPLPLFLAFAGAAYLCIGLRMPKKAARRQRQRYEQSGSETAPEVLVRFDADSFTGVREGAEPTEIDYHSLQAVYPNGSQIILWTENKQFIVLDRARFAGGSESDFWNRMKQACPAALPKGRRG